MKLELKHIAGYLPYGLKVMENYDDFQIEMLGIYTFNDIYTDGGDITFEGFKPILRPLSDLTKEIEVNGEKFVPLDYFEQDSIADYFADNIWVKFLFEDGKCNDLDLIPYGMIEKLYEWHFDIFNLIENNLAIDINTL